MPVDPATVKEILVSAHAAVEEAGLPAELQEVAFAKAVDLFASEAGISPADKKPAKKPTTPAGSAGAEGSTERLEQIASALSIEQAEVEEASHIDAEDELKLSFNAPRLANGSSAATKQVALLLAAGRQEGGWDTWTETKLIRSTCDELRVLSSGNFANTIADMGDVFSFSGSGRDRKVKIKRKGLQDAAALIRDLTGGDST
jgi:hypothetical protein